VSDFETNLTTGLAVLLAGSGIGLSWSPTGAYDPLSTGITLGKLTQSPDNVVTLQAYGVSDDPSLSDSVLGVQVICRCGGQDKRPSDDLADEIFNLLHGARAVTLSTGVYVVQCLRNSAASLGQDVNERWMNTANYYVTVYRPSANRQ